MENFQLIEEEVVLTKRQSYMHQAILRTGETRFNNSGSLMCIDEYNSSADIWVRFMDSGYMVHTNWQSFIKGEVKNVYDRNLYGVGYIGEGNYKTRENGKATPQYIAWNNMLKRCYSQKFQERYSTYKNCYACDEWHNFQAFAKWYDENYYIIDGQRMEIEKDILVKGNKVYSPETVIFVPQCINLLFTKRDSMRGELPIGVRYLPEREKFNAQCNNGTKKKNLGNFDTIEAAFNAYKTYKELLIKKVASQFRDKIPSKLYEALINYTVEIND